MWSSVSAANTDLTIVFAADMTQVGDSQSGSYAQLATLLQSQRQRKTPTFFFFGGGSLGPSSLSSLDRGAHIIDLLNSLEPDVMALTKREFSYFEDELSLRAYEAAFPMVSANLFDPLIQSSLDGVNRYAVISRAGKRIGVTSVISPDVKTEYALKRLDILAPEQALLRQIQTLKAAKCDVIVVLYDAYYDFIEPMLQQGIIDLAIRKDEHYVLNENNLPPEHPNNIVLVGASDAVVIDVTLASQSDQQPTFAINTIKINTLSPQADIQLQETEYLHRLNKLMNVVLGKTATDLDMHRLIIREREAVIGNFIADVIRQYSNADIAFINSGNIRSDSLLPAGSVIRRQDFANILPYRNNVVKLQITGSILYEAMENSVSQLEYSNGRFLQISGFSVEYDSQAPAGKRVKQIFVNGMPLTKDKILTAATSDYLANGGDGYSTLDGAPRLKYDNYQQVQLSKLIADEIRKVGVIAPAIEGRLVDVYRKPTS